MLTQITEEFFIDFNEILFVDKEGKQIRIYVKNGQTNNAPLTISSPTKEGKAFISKLTCYLRERSQHA